MTYDFLSPLIDNELYEAPIDSIPDTRNTLLWNSYLEINNNSFPIKFYTSDTPGIYSVIVQGLNIEGKRIRYSLDFEVK